MTPYTNNMDIYLLSLATEPALSTSKNVVVVVEYISEL